MMQPRGTGVFSDSEHDRDIRDRCIIVDLVSQEIDSCWLLVCNRRRSFAFIVGHVFWVDFWAVGVWLVAIVYGMGYFHILYEEWVEVQCLSKTGEVVRVDEHSIGTMCHSEPPAHQFHLQSIDWSVVAFVAHNPFDTDAVADVREWYSIKHMPIFEDPDFESGCLAKIGVEVTLGSSTDSSTKCAWEKSKASEGEVEFAGSACVLPFHGCDAGFVIARLK
jgi:hypothetical protein